MPARNKPDLKGVRSEAAKPTTSGAKTPMVQRRSSHRERIALAIKELQSERLDLVSRRDQLRRQTEALEGGFALHLDDIEATLKLYQGGLTSLAIPSGSE